MTKAPNNPPSRIADLARSVRARASVWGRFKGAALRAVDGLASPSMGWGLLIAIIFAAVCSVTAAITRLQPLVAVGRVMDTTRIVRHEIVTEDESQTQQRREAARQATPRVYVADAAAIDAIVRSLENLPKTLAAAESPADVDPTIREQFGLTADLLKAVKGEVVEGEASPVWRARVRTLAALLLRRPLLDQQTWQRGTLEGTAATIKLMADGKPLSPVLRTEAVNVDDKEALSAAMQAIARDSGFVDPLRAVVVARLTRGARPTYAFDAAATAKDQNDAAAAAPPARTVSPVGQVIFRRGEVLTEAAAAMNRAELELAESMIPQWLRVARTGGVVAACGGITLALTGYIILFCPRIRRNAGRIAGVAGVLMVAMVAACAASAFAPDWIALTATAPTILVALLMTLAYDRRAALAFGLLHGLLVCIGLRQGIGTMAVMVTGTACVVWSLREIRDRNTLLRASVIIALGVALAQIVFGIIERPTLTPVYRELLLDALKAGGGALALGAGAVLLLPMIERAFNVTTGLTLMELRDPKQPLLRELAQRAPGTYTHSLNVATICEAAADAVGADGLLAYVGAMYHDIGKMNKPEYFVENQQGGPNKHDRLSPAMSLLIVVGHVKDGLELAREFRLPGMLMHFIEAHHGTTLVEFFFHRACRQAEGDEGDASMPDEFEYRYPGPKPRTREVAILMIADAVESACRAMPDPTPARVDQLVRTIAHKRLMDGQFDDCELTLRDLNIIVESVSRTVASMHHGRIAYPDDEPAVKAQ